MINICKTELDWLDMHINLGKTKCLKIGKRHNCKTAHIVIDNNAILWCYEIRYLGIFLVSGSTFKCDPHNAKMKYFRCLNGILGKIGTTTPIDVSLSLVASFSTVLLYGFDSGCLSNAQIEKLKIHLVLFILNSSLLLINWSLWSFNSILDSYL